MRYTYPKISNSLTYKRINIDTVVVTDHLNDNSYTFDIEAVRYVRQLNGYTHPYKIPSVFSRQEIHDILEFLDQNDLIRHSDIRNVSFGTKLKTLWTPKLSASQKMYAYLFNAFLMIFWLPILLTGTAMFIHKSSSIEYDLLWFGFIGGLVCGMLFHELGHAFAGISYGAHVFEMGVFVMYCILPGAYVLLDRAPVKMRLQRIQINAAGVEANFLLGGVFLILGSWIPFLGGMFLNAAICNIILGMFNLSLIKGLDGTSILSELLGIDDIIELSKKMMSDRKAREYVIRRGAIGYAIITVCVLLWILQTALPVLLILNVLEIVLCFV